jgi:hypothetical protein
MDDRYPGQSVPASPSGAAGAGESATLTRPRRVLLVADERFRGGEFADELRSHLHGDLEQVEVLVIAPSLAHSALDHEMANFDRPIAEARDRLDSILAELGSIGIDAAGEVGDGDPTVAVGDGLREFPADEIIVVGHAEGRSRAYSEKDLWNRLRRNFAEPITALMVDPPDVSGAPGHVVAVEHTPARDHIDEDEMLASRNFPPLLRRDIVGILVGFIGTIALGLVAVAAGINEGGQVSGVSAAILMIAIGAFLINVANMVGLLLFQSVRYDGIWERFFARSSFVYTVAGLIASIALWLFAT